jgi:hypothetical protein
MIRKTPVFPTPIKQGDGKYAHTFFRFADAVHYIDAVAGDPPRHLSGDDLIRLITERKFRELLGGVSKMFIHRRLPKNQPSDAHA